MKRFLLSGFLFLSLTTAAYAETEERKLFNAESFTLSNGLQVVVIPNHRAPIVTHMLWYKVGSADEPQGDGVSGEAHFLEHLLFKGTKAIGPGQFSRIIRSIGGNDNAFTSWDYTAFFQNISKPYLETVMAMEADRMINLNPPVKEIAPEHQVIIEERRQRTDNDPKALFSEQLRSVLYNQSPYGVPIIGWKEEMPNITWEKAKDYYQKWYAPNNAILIVSGDVTGTEMKSLAEKYYGFLPRKDIPTHIRPLVPDAPAPVIVTFNNEAVQQPVYMKAVLAPSFVQNKKESYALQVLENTISSGAATQLYQSLVVKQKLAVNIDMNYDDSNRGQGSLWIYATPADGITLTKLETAIADEFRQMIKNGIAEEEISKAKTRMIDSAIYARDSIQGPAQIIGQAMASGASLDDVEFWPQRVDEVTSAQVTDALKKYLDPDHPHRYGVTGYMLPPGEKP